MLSEDHPIGKSRTLTIEEIEELVNHNHPGEDLKLEFIRKDGQGVPKFFDFEEYSGCSGCGGFGRAKHWKNEQVFRIIPNNPK